MQRSLPMASLLASHGSCYCRLEPASGAGPWMLLQAVYSLCRALVRTEGGAALGASCEPSREAMLQGCQPCRFPLQSVGPVHSRI